MMHDLSILPHTHKVLRLCEFSRGSPTLTLQRRLLDNLGRSDFSPLNVVFFDDQSEKKERFRIRQVEEGQKIILLGLRQMQKKFHIQSKEKLSLLFLISIWEKKATVTLLAKLFKILILEIESITANHTNCIDWLLFLIKFWADHDYIPEWTAMWTFFCCSLAKDFWQTSHLYGRAPESKIKIGSRNQLSKELKTSSSTCLSSNIATAVREDRVYL